MTQKLEDLIKSFTDLSFDEQLQKIRDVRSARNIERPAAAVKRVKRAAKKSNAAIGRSRNLLAKLSPAEKALLIEKLKGA